MKIVKYHPLHMASGSVHLGCTASGFALVFFLVASFIATPGYSAVFNLSENGSGLDTLPVTFAELPHSIDGLTTPWPVDIGNNVFVGSFGCLTFLCNTKPTNNIDVFRIRVPVELQITNIRVESFGSSAGTKHFEFGEFGDVGGIFDGSVDENGFDITSILNAGIYDARTTKIVGTVYRWTFTASTAVIPLPSAMLLMGTGLAGLFGYGLHRQKLRSKK